MADQPLPEGTDSILDENGVEAESDAIADLDDADVTELADDIALEQEQEPEQADGEQQQAGGTEQAAAGGGADDDANDGGGGSAESGAGDFRSAFFGKFDALRGQATDRVFTLAQDGKDRATAALDDLVRTVEDAAGEIDSRIGTQYGDYARRAAESLGGFSDAFKGKDVDALFTDARELVKKSPAVAIGAAAALGFVVARLVKASVPEAGGADDARPDAKAG